MGRVDVDGETFVELGVMVDPEAAKIRVDGVPLKRQKTVYYAVHKPVGVVTTNRDPMGRPRVIDLVPPTERVFPVGRLDRSSEGLILLTNDGDLAQRLAHPRFGIQKVYRVIVAGQVDAETLKQMRKGIYIAEGLVRVDGAKILKARPRATEMEITLREGKNREIRRILARLGHKVQSLRRIAVGSLRLGELPAGAYRPLSRTEIDKLKAAVIQAEKGSPSTSDDSNKPTRPRKQGSNLAKRKRPELPSNKPPRPNQSKPDKPLRPSGKPKPTGRGEIVIRVKPIATIGTIIGAETDERPKPARTGPRKKGAKAAERKSSFTSKARKRK
jgi:23S rRNA pseudouridine2605 synthase